MPASLSAQRGAALLALTAVMVLAGAWLTVQIAGDGRSRAIAEGGHNGSALKEAKEALIGHVARTAADLTEHFPGRLPCPEDPSYVGNAEYEGVAAAFCALPAVGRLPWRTLGLRKLVDYAGEPLWYVVSAGWSRTAVNTTLQINSNTNGQLTVDGIVPATPTPTNTYAALIIAPGPPLKLTPNSGQLAAGCSAYTQTRTSGTLNAVNYLECQNSAAPTNTFVTTVIDNATNQVFNDQVVTIGAWEILNAIEAPVAARIESTVVPHLKALYNSSQWSASAAAPVYPYAAPFANPSTSTYQGSAATTQGLLPLVRMQNCTAGTDAYCDPTFIKWDTASPITVSKFSGTATLQSFNCSASTSSAISCSITYGRSCLFCTATMRVDVLPTAQNIGMSMRSFPTVSSPNGWSSVSVPVNLSIAANGSVNPTFRGTLTTLLCFGSCSATAIVTIPASVFGDHYFLNPTSPFPEATATAHEWWWFLNANWHHVVYYAVAPGNAPSGATTTCTSSPLTCLSITNVTPADSQRAVLIFAGRTLTGSARPNGTLADFLDNVSAPSVAAGANRDLDNAFHKAMPGTAFNDRFIVVDAN